VVPDHRPLTDPIRPVPLAPGEGAATVSGVDAGPDADKHGEKHGASVDLARVPVGLCEDGTPYRLRLLGTHVLVVGATGSGGGR
jgi:hypothetical protein